MSECVCCNIKMNPSFTWGVFNSCKQVIIILYSSTSLIQSPQEHMLTDGYNHWKRRHVVFVGSTWFCCNVSWCLLFQNINFDLCFALWVHWINISLTFCCYKNWKQECIITQEIVYKNHITTKTSLVYHYRPVNIMFMFFKHVQCQQTRSWIGLGLNWSTYLIIGRWRPQDASESSGGDWVSGPWVKNLWSICYFENKPPNSTCCGPRSLRS